MCHTEHISLEPSPLNQLLNLKNTMFSVVVQLWKESVKTGLRHWFDLVKLQNRSDRPVFVTLYAQYCIIGT